MNTNTAKRLLTLPALCVLASFGMATLAACDNEGPAEKAGEKIDEGVKDTGRAIEDATD